MTVEELFLRWSDAPCQQRVLLPPSGSNRRYLRLSNATHHCIATVNEDVSENRAFIALAKHFAEAGIQVPAIYAVSPDEKCYLQQDLGDRTLYTFLYDRQREGLGFDAEVLAMYKSALSHLVSFQLAGSTFDFDLCYPRSDFDRQSMQWDLNYFKYFFLRLAHIPFDEQLLEDDFQHLMDYLLDDEMHFFMYRDFQGRNIMLTADDEMYFIDFQGGRRGPLHYDVASLLYSSKSNMPDAIRQQLLEYYISQARPMIENSGTVEAFRRRYYGFVLLRIMQALGAYGYRGYCEHKDYFLKSIPYAVANLRTILDNHRPDVELPHLYKVLYSLQDTAIARGNTTATIPSDRLTVEVYSFSYREAIPEDSSSNGGGFVFDCRALPNPGRQPEYRSSTGMDADVIAFMRSYDEVGYFMQNVQRVVFQSVKRYCERHFSHLMISFGCTGGQHRSVYCAEQMAAAVKQQFPDCDVVIHHVQQKMDRIII